MSPFLSQQISAFPFTVPALGLQTHEFHTYPHNTLTFLYSFCSCHKALHLFHLSTPGSCFSTNSSYRLYSHFLKMYFILFLVSFFLYYFIFFYIITRSDSCNVKQSCFSIILPILHLPSHPSNAVREYFPLLA